MVAEGRYDGPPLKFGEIDVRYFFVALCDGYGGSGRWERVVERHCDVLCVVCHLNLLLRQPGPKQCCSFERVAALTARRGRRIALHGWTFQGKPFGPCLQTVCSGKEDMGQYRCLSRLLLPRREGASTMQESNTSCRRTLAPGIPSCNALGTTHRPVRRPDLRVLSRSELAPRIRSRAGASKGVASTALPV